MKWLLLIFVSICLLLSSCFMGSSLLFLDSDSQNKPNLVGNPSFENPDSKNHALPEGWYLVSTAANKSEPVALDSISVVSGSKSLRIVNSSKDMYLVSDAFRVVSDGGYYAKFSIRAQKKMDKSTRIFFWAYDDTGAKKNSFRKSIKARTDWKKASISAGFLNKSVSFARIAIFIPKDSGNTIWIDDIGCYMVHQFTKQ